MNTLYAKMIEYYSGDPKRIQHFTKVHSYARLIGQLEHLSDDTQNILEIAALVHDIGIKISELKYGNCNGKNQEKEGKAEAEKLLTELGYPQEVIERVSYLVGHHHSYDQIEGIDYQILVEADFIVNMYEDAEAEENCRKVCKRIFKTESGTRIFKEMFGI